MSILDDQNVLQDKLDNTIANDYYAPINSFLNNICAENMIGINKYNILMIFKDNHWIIDEVLSGECLKILIDAGATLNDLQNDNIKNYIEEYKESIIKTINVHNYSIYCNVLLIHKNNKPYNNDLGLNNVIICEDYEDLRSYEDKLAYKDDASNVIKANDSYLSIGKI